HFLEHYAESKRNKEITKLLQLNPTNARRKKPDGEIKIVDVAEITTGDHLSILNGDQIPTDGIISSVESAMNQEAKSGESITVEKKAGDTLFGSKINGTGTMIMEVTKDSSETVISQIIEMVSQAQTNISRTAALIKRIEPVYVSIVLVLTP